jgi:hypothetical protein
MTVSDVFKENALALRSPAFVSPAAKTWNVNAHATPVVVAAVTPWWLWWNILSLDAPTVAVVWALLFANASHAHLRFSDALLLSLAVWVIYTGDRVLDGAVAKLGTPLQERHLSCARHRKLFIVLLSSAIVAILWLLANRATKPEDWAGMKLGVIVGAYMLGIHAGSGFLARIIPKEIAVGVLFAAGTTLPVWSRYAGFSANFCFCLSLFAALCSLNCLSIERWESHPSTDDVENSRPPFVAWGSAHLNAIAATLAMFALLPIFIFHAHETYFPEYLAIFIAAILLYLLNLNRRLFSPPALRVLADAALVLAALFALAIRM